MKLPIILSLSLLSGQAFAENLKDLSLEDLMNIEVEVASKKTSSLLFVPGNVSVYTNNDLKNMGAYTLSKVSQYVPGYSSYLGFGERSFITRGQKVSGFDNNHHLLLIDGIRVSHARANRVFMEEEISLFGAEKVEFLTGPASALYGTGAFSGVINIKSRKQKDVGNSMNSYLSYGTHARKNLMLDYNSRSNLGLTNIQLSTLAKDASRDQAGDGSSDWPSHDNKKTVYLNTSFEFTKDFLEGLKFGYIHSFKETGMGAGFFGSSAGSADVNEIAWEMAIPYVKFSRNITDKIKLNSYLKMNTSMEKSYYASGSNTTSYEISYREYEGLLESSTSIFSDDDLLTVGLDYVHNFRQGRPDSFEYNGSLSSPSTQFYVDSKALKTTSLFFEYTGGVSLVEYTIGAREDFVKGPNADFNQFSPRVSLVTKIGKNSSIKYLWGNALRAPNLKNLLLNEQAIQENKDSAQPFDEIPTNITAERIESHELSYNHSFLEKNFLKLITFYNIRKDTIERVNIQNKDVFTNNKGQTKAYGLELEYKFKDNKNWETSFNYSYAKAQLPSGADFSDVPKSLASLSFFLHENYLLPFSVFFGTKYQGDFRVSSPDKDGVKSNFISDVKLGKSLFNDWVLELSVFNILDEEVKHQISDNKADVLPGRALNLSLRGEF